MNIEWLLEQGPCKKFNAGDVIPCVQNKPGEQNAMYILLSGSVDVFGNSPAGGLKKVSTIIAGDVFGGREYFQGPTDLLYRAVDNIDVYLLTEESFNDLSWAQPDILFEILRSAYMPQRPPVKSAPIINKAATPTTSARQSASGGAGEHVVDRAEAQARVAANAKAAAAAKEVASVFLPGHRLYTEKTFPMNERLVYPKEYNCPFCKRKFHDFRVFSSKLVESRPMRYDFRKFYEDFNAEWYDLITCSHCNFTTFHTYFTDPKPLKKSAIEDRLSAACVELPVGFSATRDINIVFTMHYLALMCCDGYPSMSLQLQGKVWANLSWLYEDVEDTQLQKAAADKAAEAFEKAFAQGNLTPVQEQVTCLSISCMQHRAGVNRDFNKYLNIVRTQVMGDKTYAKLADEFIADKQITVVDEPDGSSDT